MAATPVTLLLGHGASGGAETMRPWVAPLKRRRVRALTLELPRSRPDAAVDAFRQAVLTNPDAAIGGHSFGGRMASLLAAQAEVSALVLLSYPLHRPGHPEELRTEHWARIRCPVLLLSGERDPFARIELLHREARKLADVTVITYPKLGHGLLPLVNDVSDQIASFMLEGRAG